MIVDDQPACDVSHDSNSADAGNIPDSLTDAGALADGQPDNEVAVAPVLSWLDPCPNQPMQAGPPTPLPAGALPVLGQACAQPGWSNAAASSALVFTDVTAAVGLGSVGLIDACVLWQDFNGDGLSDLVVASRQQTLNGPHDLVLYPGNDAGGFGAPVKSPFGPGFNAVHVGDCAPIDYDNDGYADIALAGTGGLMLWHNNADGKFINKTSLLVPYEAQGQMAWSIGVLDYDRDGDLDIYVAMTGQLNLQPGQFECRSADGSYYQCCTGSTPFDTACLGQLGDKAKTYTCCSQVPVGANNVLLRNDGDVPFAVVKGAGGADDPHASLTATVADLDRDGWPDLFVGNDFGALSWYRNHGDSTFQGLATSIGLRPYGHVMGSAVADWNGDGWPDLVTADFGPTTLYHGSAKGFENVSAAVGVQAVTKDAVSWAMMAADFNDDGWPDLFTGQSMVATQGGLPAAVQGDVGKLAPDGYHVTYRNTGGGLLEAQKLPWPQNAVPVVDSVVVASNDLDGDGDLDLAVQAPGGMLQIVRNDTPNKGHWLNVQLSPDKSPAGGVGALVQVWSGGHVQEHEIQATPGFGVHGEQSSHFGLGSTTEVDQVRVWWPTGKVSLIGKTKADQALQVAEKLAFGNEIVAPADATGGDAVDAGDGTPAADAFVAGQDVTPLDLTKLPEAAFTEITSQLGLGGAPDKYAYCTLGADLDGDGRDDIVLIENPAPEKFQVHTLLMKAAGPVHVITAIDGTLTNPAYGCNAADLNGDGFLDLLIGTSFGMTVLQNQGKGDFLDISTQILPPIMDFTSWSIAAGDLDHDQDIELFVGAGDFNAGCQDVQCSYIPGDFACTFNKPQIANAVNQDRILRRQPGKPFADVTGQFPVIPSGGLATTATFVDLDQDGWMDVLVGNDFGAHYLLRNQGGKLTRFGTEIGFLPYAHMMGWSVGDFNRDGLLDLAAADAGPMLLYMQQPNPTGVPLQFAERAGQAGLAAATHDTSSWNPMVADFDQDGWEDIYVGLAGIAPNGELGPLGMCIEPKNPSPQRDLLFRNLTDGTFKPMLAPKPASQALGFAAIAQSLLDVDDDGDLDVLQVRRNGDVHVYRNDMAKPGSSVILRLKAKTGNTQALGARVTAEVGGVKMVRQLTGNQGFGSPGMWSVHFGLGTEPMIEKITVQWPNGTTSSKSAVAAGSHVQMTQP